MARYAVLGPAAFAQVEVGQAGSRDTVLEEPCTEAHWGFVLRGRLTFEGAERTTTFAAGTAFYVPPGPPAHRFVAPGACSVAGFAPVVEPVDESPEALAAKGIELVVAARPQPAPPAMLHVAGEAAWHRTADGIEAESAQMGPWTFMRTTYGALSGFISGPCDLPHWGMVLAGEVVHSWDEGLELLTPGDVFYCPPGPPGHRFEVADSATLVDYTPTDALRGPGRRPAYRDAARLAGAPGVAA
ncbi:MAG TPA: hypothetical protein VMH24_07005 [Candidatus Sulfotelmatobacter sp.]|nr:hypothetical protein [Candidatus Sulfotelmatobacter sp.]